MDEQALLQKLFEEAVELGISERERFLLEHCASDEMREHVMRMLRIHDETDGDFERPITERFRDLLDAPGEKIGDFEIIRETGRGGMSVVYLARDTVLDREVALKVLGADRSLSETVKQRFLNEARAAAGLNHPNIVKIFRYGQTDRHGFIAMDYISNGTFDQWLLLHDRNSAEGRREIVLAIESIAEALEHAHRAGVIHRDVKPTNILMDRQGRPYLADFGIARMLDTGNAHETLAGAGTAAYMSPEQIAAVRDEIDHRSDVFSLGVVLYEALVGQLPFKGRSGEEIKESIRKTDPVKPRSIVRSLPRDLEVICGKAMEKKPEDRYPTVGHMAADLRAWMDGKPILARPPSLIQRSVKKLPSRRSVLISIGAAAVGIPLGMYLMPRQRNTRSVIDAALLPDHLTICIRLIDPVTQLPGEVFVLGSSIDRTFTVEHGHYRILVVNEAELVIEIERMIIPVTLRSDHDLESNQVARSIIDSGSLQLEAIEFSLEKNSMVLIPGGSELDFDEEKNINTGGYFERVRKVEPFYLDKYEVSCSEYEKFLVKHDEIPFPPHWGARECPDGWENKPVTGVTYFEARAFAESQGKRLPSAPEWELAAKGSEAWKLLWWGRKGNEPSPNEEDTLAYIQDHIREPVILRDYINDKIAKPSAWSMPEPTEYQQNIFASETRDVHDAEKIDITPLGIYNMMGNVAELTESTAPFTPLNYDYQQKSIESNHWSMPERPALLIQMGMQSVNERRIGVGFRCARTKFYSKEN